MLQANSFKRPAAKSSTSKNRFEASLQDTINSKEEYFQKVAEKAYEFYVARGCQNGHDAEDWAKAEELLKVA